MPRFMLSSGAEVESSCLHRRLSSKIVKFTYGVSRSLERSYLNNWETFSDGPALRDNGQGNP